jgi:hypothetical protein
VSDSWYLANDFWFMIFALNMVDVYYKNKKMFLVLSGIMSTICLSVQTVQIVMNDFSPSYLTFDDEYWTLYFKKPFCHFHGFAIGMFFGCSYFTYKVQSFSEGSKIAKFFEGLKNNNMNAYTTFTLGVLVQLIILVLNKMIQNNPNQGMILTLLWLLLSRPLYCCGFSLIVMPLIIGNEGL